MSKSPVSKAVKSVDVAKKAADVAATREAAKAITSDRVVIFDTTLRDGEQCPGATMTFEEKLDPRRMGSRGGHIGGAVQPGARRRVNVVTGLVRIDFRHPGLLQPDRGVHRVTQLSIPGVDFRVDRLKRNALCGRCEGVVNG